jgi:hypothetical protein
MDSERLTMVKANHILSSTDGTPKVAASHQFREIWLAKKDTYGTIVIQAP